LKLKEEKWSTDRENERKQETARIERQKQENRVEKQAKGPRQNEEPLRSKKHKVAQKTEDRGKTDRIEQLKRKQEI